MRSRTQQVNLVNDQQSDRLHIAACLPAATDAVPFLRRRHYHVSSANCLHVRCYIACQLHNPTANSNLFRHYIHQKQRTIEFSIATTVTQQFCLVVMHWLQSSQAQLTLKWATVCEQVHYLGMKPLTSHLGQLSLLSLRDGKTSISFQVK